MTIQRAVAALRARSEWQTLLKPPPNHWPQPSPPEPVLREVLDPDDRYQYFADWDRMGKPDFEVHAYLGDRRVSRYRRTSEQPWLLMRWDSEELEGYAFSSATGRWVESDNLDRNFYLGQGILMDPVSWKTAQDAVIGYGHPHALDDTTFVELEDEFALGEVTELADKAGSAEAESGVDRLIGEVMPALRPDVVRRILGWWNQPDT